MGIKFILLFLLLSALILAVAYSIEVYYDRIFKPIHKEKITSYLQYKFFEKLQTADVINYDSTDMYTAVTLANEEVAVRPLAVTDNCFRGFECLAATGIIIFGAIATNLFVFFICMFSFCIGIIITNVRSKKVVQYDKQMKEKDKKISMLHRLLYLPEYAKEHRISHVSKVILQEYTTTIDEKKVLPKAAGKILPICL